MSNNFLDEKIVEEEKTTIVDNNINVTMSESAELPEQETRKIFTKFDILAPIDEEHHIEYYKNHVLNFNKSDGMAHIIRGVTSIVGELNFAVFDIFIGIYKLYNKKEKTA